MEESFTKLFHLVDLAYAAAVEPKKWPVFLQEVSASYKDASTILWHTDSQAADIGIFESFRYEPSCLRSLQEHYYNINPWLPAKMRIPTGRLHRTDALYPTSELVKTEFYNDWLKPNDLFNGFGISLYNDHRFAFLSIVRSRRAGAPSRKELQVLEVLMPHLQRAVQLHEKFATLPAGNAQSADLLDQLPIGIIAIGSDGRALRINAAAEQICRQRDGFGVDRRGFCRLDHLSQQKHLRSLISDAVRTGQRIGFGAGGALSAQRPSMRRPYSILVAPMPSPRFDLGTRAVAAIILISDPDAEIATAPQMLQQLYGLSAAEARLVDALLNGKRFEEAADEFGISLNTAKTQLKSIFRKTDTSRQAELLKLILTGPLRFATPRTGEDEAH